MKKNRKVAFVCCGGGTRAKKREQSEVLSGDCQTALVQENGGLLQCRFGCQGLGSCIAACPVKAITANSAGVAEVSRERCIGCQKCVKACPQQLIRMIAPDTTVMPRCSNHDLGAAARAVCSVSCISCRMCEKNCPVEAIKMIDDCAAIDEPRCISCGMCVVKCPRETIVDADGIFAVR